MKCCREEKENGTTRTVLNLDKLIYREDYSNLILNIQTPFKLYYLLFYAFWVCLKIHGL
jgi:hypothetical protein